MSLVRRYLDAVGVAGTPAPTLPTLARLLSGHVAAFPYETLGMALGQDYGLDPEACVERALSGRAGYCYTQNAAFTWALERLGFDVRHHLGVVTGRTRPDPTEVTGGHMAVTVVVDDVEYLADAGLGPGPVLPTPLIAGEFSDGRFTHRLEPSPLPDGDWRLVLDPATGGFRTMDFRAATTPLGDFVGLHEERRHIGTEGCPYFLVERPTPEHVDILVGIRLTGSREQEVVLRDLDAWRDCVRDLGCRALDAATPGDVAALHARLVREHDAFHRA